MTTPFSWTIMTQMLNFYFFQMKKSIETGWNERYLMEKRIDRALNLINNLRKVMIIFMKLIVKEFQKFRRIRKMQCFMF